MVIDIMMSICILHDFHSFWHRQFLLNVVYSVHLLSVDNLHLHAASECFCFCFWDAQFILILYSSEIGCL